MILSDFFVYRRASSVGNFITTRNNKAIAVVAHNRKGTSPFNSSSFPRNKPLKKIRFFIGKP